MRYLLTFLALAASAGSAAAHPGMGDTIAHEGLHAFELGLILVVAAIAIWAAFRCLRSSSIRRK